MVLDFTITSLSEDGLILHSLYMVRNGDKFLVSQSLDREVLEKRKEDLISNNGEYVTKFGFGCSRDDLFEFVKWMKYNGYNFGESTITYHTKSQKWLLIGGINSCKFRFDIFSKECYDKFMEASKGINKDLKIKVEEY